MKIVVDKIPNCSSDCIFSRYFSCERRRCILTDNICVLDSDVPCECHKLTTNIVPITEVKLDTEALQKALLKQFGKYLEKGE